MSSPLRAIVFDYSQVLTFPTKEGHLREMAMVSRVDYDGFQRAYAAHLRDYDRGRYDGQEFWTHVLSAVGIEAQTDLITTLIARDTENQVAVNPVVLSWADQLAGEDFTTAILSNMSNDDVLRMRKAHIFDLLVNFHDRVLSAEVGFVKPEPEMYQLCLSRLRMEPAQVLFIDDNEENVRGASDLGIHAYLFTDSKTDLPEIARRFHLPSPRAIDEATKTR